MSLISDEYLSIVSRVSALLGDGWVFMGYKEYMFGMQFNWRRGNLSVMWRDEYGEKVEVYDNMLATFKTFKELKYMK